MPRKRKKGKKNKMETKMRQHWLRERSKTRLTSLYALRSLPTELRQLVMEPMIRLEWRGFVEENKHRFQRKTDRRKDSKRELKKLGCGNIRSDSTRGGLCAAFVNGSLTSKVDGPQWTAKRVARREAEMKYM